MRLTQILLALEYVPNRHFAYPASACVYSINSVECLSYFTSFRAFWLGILHSQESYFESSRIKQLNLLKSSLPKPSSEIIFGQKKPHGIVEKNSAIGIDDRISDNIERCQILTVIRDEQKL